MSQPATHGSRSAVGHSGSIRAVGRARKVLVVDDSAVVRRLVNTVIEDAAGLRVIGEADHGTVAIRAATRHRPDIIVLDLHMPGMGGLDALRTIRANGIEARVVVFANVLPEDVDRVAESVREAGAELVVKPTGVSDYQSAVTQVRDRLLPVLVGGKVADRPSRVPSVGPVNAVVLASSTGGPQALEQVLGGIVHLPVPLFIVQHIADGFSARLAERLDQVCRFTVVEAEHGMRPAPGQVYVSPGGRHLVVERADARPVLHLSDDPPVNSCRPSADVLFRSSAAVYGANQVAVVLTGIGQDGLDGCRELSALGVPIIVQDEASSVVWGMPGAVAEAGLADEILPLDQVAAHLDRLTAVRKPSRRKGGSRA